MNDTTTTWPDVGNRLSALLLKLKLHAEEELSQEDMKTRLGLKRLGDAFEEMADAIGDAYKDPAVRADAQELARLFSSAAENTVRDAAKHMPSKT